MTSFRFNPPMFINLPFFIGLRYISSKRREGFVSFVSLFSFCAMALGVMALIVVLSVMNGFDREIKTRILNIIPHITLQNSRGIEDWADWSNKLAQVPGVSAVMPFVDGPAMLTFGNRFQGISLQGIDPALPQETMPISEHLIFGDMQQLQPGSFGVVLGSMLAQGLGVITGDTLLLTLPQVTVTPVGIFPRVKRVTVVGIFQVGAQVDEGIAFIHIADARRLLRLGDRVKGLRVILADPFSDSAAATIRAQLPEYIEMSTWQESLGSLFRAIRMEKMVVGLLLMVIVGVAAFNIVASLVLMVNDKRKDIAVLRTMGADARTIAAIFRIQGGVVGIVGVVTGVLIGCVVAINIGAIVAGLESLFGFYLFDPGLYFIRRLPSHLLWQDVALIATAGVVLSLLATLYPAARAGQVQPAEALRYDH